MERLTEWFYDHWGTRTERLNGKLVGTQTCLDKLAEYENLEEQGLLKVFWRCNRREQVFP